MNKNKKSKACNGVGDATEQEVSEGKKSRSPGGDEALSDTAGASKREMGTGWGASGNAKSSQRERTRRCEGLGL